METTYHKTNVCSIINSEFSRCFTSRLLIFVLQVFIDTLEVLSDLLHNESLTLETCREVGSRRISRGK